MPSNLVVKHFNIFKYTAFSLFSGLVGCACSDNPSQAINDENGYCKLQVKFDRDTR
ncbi:hypothetical protein [uncultured Gammaproteobacteria bacterium]|nr:hypothetical protein [uncultured Gammaproteobacteria bacterium]